MITWPTTVKRKISVISNGYAWGENWWGQLGLGTRNNMEHIPTEISGNFLWHSLATGGVHCLGIRSDGLLFAWGGNHLDQLGIGNSNVMYISTPVQIGVDHWSFISCRHHSLGIRLDGLLFAWGDNWAGQLGDGTTINKNVPTQIGNHRWSFAAAGGSHSLGIRSDGLLFAWGSNWAGQLGDGTTIDKHTPAQISSNIWRGAHTSGGAMHSFAYQQDGSLFGWGANWHGRVGTGSFDEYILTPTRLPNNNSWLAAYAGGMHSLGITFDYVGWGWGSSESGQLGFISGWQNPFIRTPILIQNTQKRFKHFSVGDFHSLGILLDLGGLA